MKVLDYMGGTTVDTPMKPDAEARLLTAVKLFASGQVSSGIAAQLAGITRVEFLISLNRFGVSAVGVNADELAEDVANATAAFERRR